MSTTVAPSDKPGLAELSLSSFIQMMEKNFPNEVIRVSRPVEPAKFEVSAILKHLENRGKFPLLVFENPTDVEGRNASMPLLSNIYASRERCAVAMGLKPEQAGMELSLEYARRLENPITPIRISRAEAPIKEVVERGEQCDLSKYPIVRHHEMDPAPYIDMTPVMRHPDEGFYNVAFLRNMYKGPRKLGIHMSPRHNWQLNRIYESRKQPTPVVVVVSHHPAFYLGALNVEAFGKDDYSIIGGIAGRALRVVESETWGDKFMVPADADMVVEGEIYPGEKEVEAPFGEFTGYYGPQRLRPVIHVTAISHRRQAHFQHIFVGHRDNWFLGGIPKEGSLYNVIKGVVPTLKAVHFAPSGSCRFNCYISIDKKVPGESKQAALAAFGTIDFIKNIVVVDADIDPFNEQEVMFAVATRTQARESVDIIKNVKGNTLDPSQTDYIMTDKLLIDATVPIGRPFAARIRVPAQALQKYVLDDYIDARKLEALPTFLDSRRSV
ncbi:MAG: UbiD family decarboxylase [Acidobacteria bacterium]|nr:UbiD family decarboxylase [Acidobacteriota bacterium]